MAGEDVAYLSAAELTGLYGSGRLSPLEATTALLARLDDLQPKLNAFCVVDRDGAVAAARESERRWRDGTPLSPVDGVPATVKDLMLMRGFPTRRGSYLTGDAPDTEDSPAVARLKEAGAVILGKTATPEFGWIAVGDSPLTGITRNPWNLDRTPGGSSAGAAAAGAAGIGVLHLGSDGAGSIRIPSCFSGVFGIKPTFGLVPAYPPSPMGLLSHHGPIARSVADAAAMLYAISHPDPRDPYGLPEHQGDLLGGFDGGVRGWRIAYSPNLGYAKVDPEIAECVAAAARQFEVLGARVEEVGKIFDSPRGALLTLWSAGAARIVAGVPAEKLRRCDPGFLAVAEAGAGIGAVEYLGADMERNALGRTMGAFHETYDLLLTPMMPVPALPVGEDLSDPASETHWVDWSPFSYPFNMTRQPAASIPCGLTKDGLPIGLQIVGALHQDAKVARAARAFEATQPVRRPPI
ncbi:MAG: amidase [Alphaproteobacteria bacterium]|nr:amidase [Alphaproteobacteria bacterium]MBV9553689.1 amidase [Alphaproteobacteria bacterium]